MNKLLANVAVFVVAFTAYWGTAFAFGKTATPSTAYFDHLASAFLHGHLYLERPLATLDLTSHRNHWYVPFPPLAALLMMPWVAMMGVFSMKTVLFCASFGAVNVALVHWLLQVLARNGWSKLGETDNYWLAALFGLGSVHWYMATTGSVWFVAQICTVTFIALAVCVAALGGSAWLTGLALATAMLGRPNVALTWPLLLAMSATHLHAREGKFDWPTLAKWSLASAVPMVLAVAGLLAYNRARFDNPLDFGYLNENVADKLRVALQTHGQFSIRYLPKNFWVMWFAGPHWGPDHASLKPGGEGLSLLLTTPALIYLSRAHRDSVLAIGAWVAVALLLVPLLLYYNTGYFQFGYRFSLDFMVPVMVLFTLAAGDRTTWPMRTLILAGALVNLGGVIWWHTR